MSPVLLPTPPHPPRPVAGALLDLADLDDTFPDLDEASVGAETLDFMAARSLGLLRSTLTGTSLEVDDEVTIEGQDSVLVDVDLSGANLRGGWKRMRFERCRIMGGDFGEAVLRDVAFVDCALDMTSFRQARLERVSFEGCRLDEVDFAGSGLTDVSIAGAALATALLEQTRLVRVDLRGAELSGVDVASIRGATIEPAQLIALAPALAVAAGLHVHTTDDT